MLQGLKNFLYICANVTNDVCASLRISKAYSSERRITNRSLKESAHFRRGFSLCRQLRFNPELTAVGLPNPSNNSEVAFVSLTENVRAMFKLTSLDLHTRKGNRVAPPSREWIIDNRQLVKTEAEKSFYHSFINSNRSRLGVMQGLKGVLNKQQPGR